jgi:cobalt-zinc-cadmium efflux system protein
LSLALLAIWVAGRPANQRNTYGYYRAELLTALVNVVLLFGVPGYIFVQSARDVLNPHSVPGAPIILAASLGLIVNLAGAGLLKDGSDQSMNMRAAYLDMVGDVFGAVGAIAAGIILLTTGWTYADLLFAAVDADGDVEDFHRVLAEVAC